MLSTNVDRFAGFYAIARWRLTPLSGFHDRASPMSNQATIGAVVRRETRLPPAGRVGVPTV